MLNSLIFTSVSWPFGFRKRDLEQFSDYLWLETDALGELLQTMGSDGAAQSVSVDPCLGMVLGPFSRGDDVFYWDFESSERGYKLLRSPGDKKVLTFEKTFEAVKSFKHAMNHLHRLCGQKTEVCETPRAAAINGAFSKKETKDFLFF